MDYLSHVSVIQHTSAEYLGLIEDHLEGRKIRFTYHRPFAAHGGVPLRSGVGDALVLLGGGPWGSAGPRNLPTLVREVELTYACLADQLPVIGIGLGAQILALAAGGGSVIAPLRCATGYARRVAEDALGGYLPQRFPYVLYQRDQALLPPSARVLAVDDDGEPALFQVGRRAFGFLAHPGFKPAIAEDLIMEFDEGPAAPGPLLEAARALAPAIERALIPIMTGLIHATGLMEPG